MIGEDLAVPGEKCSFGVVKAPRAHLGPDVSVGLANLGEAVERVLP